MIEKKRKKRKKGSNVCVIVDEHLNKMSVQTPLMNNAPNVGRKIKDKNALKFECKNKR